MADKDITIGIKAVGAQQAAQAIDRVGDATEQLANNAGKDTARAMETMADKARVAEFACYDLDKEIKKTTDGSNKFSASQVNVQSSSRNSAQALLMFSQGFEDAQYGIRGVLNNIPGLVIALGGGAGLAGAISLGAVALSQIIPLFQKTGEKASDVADRIAKTAENMAKLDAQRFEAVADGIEAARSRAEALKQEFDETRAAENAFSTAAIDNTEKLAEAQRNVAEALGRQVNSQKELQAIAAAEEEKRRVAAQQAIDAENQRLSAAQDAAAVAGDNLQQQKQRAFLEEANLLKMRGQLEVLRKQKAELEKIARFANVPLTFAGPGEVTDPNQAALLDKRIAGQKAQAKLKDPVLEAKIEGTQAKVDQLESLIKTLTKDNGIIAQAETALLAAQTKITDISSAVATNIERIENTLTADNLLARTETAVKTAEQQAKDITSAVSQIETTTAAGAAAKQTLEAAAADGKITADETQRVAQATSQIIAQIQGGLANAGNNTQQVLALLRTVAEQEARNAREIGAMQRQINQLQARIR